MKRTIDSNINEEQWQCLINGFQSRLMDDFPISECITCLINDYILMTEIVEQEQSYKDQAGLEVKKESREVFFERKMKPVWDYIYSLQRQINTLKNDLQDEKVARKMYGPALSPTTYPTNVPPNGVPDYNWHKVSSIGTGNVYYDPNEGFGV